jgi:uncharacterized RDD family membrane protein YckC
VADLAWSTPAPTDEAPLATVPARFGAMIVDLLLTMALGLVGGFAGMYVGIFFLSDEPTGGRMPVRPYASGAPLVYWVIVLVAHAIAEALGGATVGKLLFGLRVRTASGQRVALWQALVRAATLVIELPIFGVVALAFIVQSKRSQRLGDRLAGTLVLKTSPSESGVAAKDRRAVLGASLGVVGVMVAGLWLGVAMVTSR